MSWIDNLENVKFSITTGDGKTYYPLLIWSETERKQDFNVTGFDFINVPGTLYERKQYRGANFPLIFYFQGENYITECNEFEISSYDKRPWTVTHPIYGTIKGQPVSIGRQNQLNISTITVDFWESIDVDYPNTKFDIKDNVLKVKNEVLDASANSYSDKPVFQSEDIIKTKDRNLQISSSFDKVLSENPLYADAYFTEYQYATSAATKAADGLLNNSFEAIRQSQALLNLPSRMETTVTTRLDAFKTAYYKIKIVLSTVADKLGFESNAGSLIANYADASVNPSEDDYQTMPDVQYAANGLLEIYNDYLAVLDGASVGIYDVDNAWQPDAEVQSNLYNIVMYTLSNLYELAFEAQQERIVYTDKTTNIILLVHRYLGMDANDDNINRFKEINNIKLKELFRIKKGRQIKYYV